MPKIDNINVAPDLTTIEYGVDTYYRLADGMDFRAGDLAYVKTSYVTFLTTGGVYEILGTRGDGRFRYIDDGGSEIHGGRDTCFADLIFFRKNPVPMKSTAELLVAKRAEIVELEAKIRREVVVGTVAVVLEYDEEEVPAGTLVQITRVDDGDDALPFLVKQVGGGETFWLPLHAIEPVTYEAARARLIAEVDRQLAAAFPGCA